MDNQDLTLLSEEQIWGETQLGVMRRYGTKASITDLCVLTGCFCFNLPKASPSTAFKIGIENLSLKGRTSFFWTRSDDNDNDVRVVNEEGNRASRYRYKRNAVVRPVLQSYAIFSQISPNRVRGDNGTEEVEYGEYPQYAADSRMQNILESEYLEYNSGHSRLNKTGRNYTFDFAKYNDSDIGFKAITYEEYEYQGKRYIRMIVNSYFDGREIQLSSGIVVKDRDYVWVEVSPVKWLIDDRTGILISKEGLVSGIRFLDKENNYKGDFNRTEMKEYLDRYMLRDLTQSVSFTHIQDQNMTLTEKVQFEELKTQVKKGIDLFGWKFCQAIEEEIRAIESEVKGRLR